MNISNKAKQSVAHFIKTVGNLAKMQKAHFLRVPRIDMQLL